MNKNNSKPEALPAWTRSAAFQQQSHLTRLISEAKRDQQSAKGEEKSDALSKFLDYIR